MVSNFDKNFIAQLTHEPIPAGRPLVLAMLKFWSVLTLPRWWVLLARENRNGPTDARGLVPRANCLHMLLADKIGVQSLPFRSQKGNR
jgi:hypothetical protein